LKINNIFYQFFIFTKIHLVFVYFLSFLKMALIGKKINENDLLERMKRKQLKIIQI